MEYSDSYAPWNFSWVVRDELAAMSCPSSTGNLRFLVEQGIKHLITLSPEKRPPIHSFPDLKWSQIPVKEFDPPTISQINKFIELCERSKIQNQVNKELRW